MSETHKTPQETVATRLREARKARQMSQRSLAERMEQLGHNWAISSVSRVEGGKRDVTVDELVALALALGVKPTALLSVDSPGVAVGQHVIPAHLFDQWLEKSKFSLGLTPDGSALTRILTIGQAVEKRQPAESQEEE